VQQKHLEKTWLQWWSSVTSQWNQKRRTVETRLDPVLITRLRDSQHLSHCQDCTVRSRVLPVQWKNRQNWQNLAV